MFGYDTYYDWLTAIPTSVLRYHGACHFPDTWGNEDGEIFIDDPNHPYAFKTIGFVEE